MKYRFFVLIFSAMFLFFGCSGEDPEEIIYDDNDSFSEVPEGGETLPDEVNSDDENGNGGSSDADKDSEKTDADSGSESGTTDNEQNSSDSDGEPGGESDSDAVPGGDADSDGESTSNDEDSVTDFDEAVDADSDTDTGSNDEDNVTDSDETSDADTDSETTDADADSDSETPDSDADSDADSIEDELTVVLPYNGDPVDKVLTLETKINRIDVLLMVDRSGFISTEHQNLKDNVKTAIVDGIQAKIPDSAFGVVKFGVFENQDAYELPQHITTSANKIKNAVDGIATATGGNRTYHGLALWAAASGEADNEHLVYFDSSNFRHDVSLHLDEADCSAQIGSIGGACFRENSMPVFVMATAKEFNTFTRNKNNGGKYDEWQIIDDSYTKEKARSHAADKMNEIHAKFIGVTVSGTSSSTNPKSDFEYIAKQTKSQDTAAAPNYFNISVEDGDSEFSSKIAEAVKNLTENIRLDVKAEFRHNGNDYGVADTTEFVESFYPESVQTVKAGTQLILDTITFKNDVYQNDSCEPHTFKVTVEVTGEGLVLDSRDITVIVPGKDCGDTH